MPTAPSTRVFSRLTKGTYALVLAGGKGSRLKNLTDWRAKPAVPFGGKFRIVDFVLSNCVNSDVRRIGIATQYKAHSLIRHIQRGWSFLDGRFEEFIDVLPASQRLDEGWYAGTADAVYQNLDILRANNPTHVLILGGDHIYKMDYGRLIADHVARDADLTVACLEVPVADATAFGVMGIDDQWRVNRFDEKPEQPAQIPGKPGLALASMGIYVFNASFLYEQLERDTFTPSSSHDFGKDVIPYLVPRCRVFAHRFADSCVGGAPGDETTGAMSERSTPIGRRTSTWPPSSPSSTCMTKTGRSGPTSSNCRRPSSCSTTRTGAASPWIPWCPAAASSAADGWRARCCSRMSA